MVAPAEIEKRVNKSTKKNKKAPKDEHVSVLLGATEESEANPKVIALIAKRLEVVDWVIVCKSLITLHRLMNEGNPLFMEEMYTKLSILNFRKFVDKSSTEAQTQSVFIRKYALYLEEKVKSHKILSSEVRNLLDTKARPSSFQEIFDAINRLQSEFNALLNCKSCKEHINNAITVNAFVLMLGDIPQIYNAIKDLLGIPLEHCATLSREDAMKTLDIYILFMKETSAMSSFFVVAKQFCDVKRIPMMPQPPTTSPVDVLKKHIATIDDSNNPAATHGQLIDLSASMDGQGTTQFDIDDVQSKSSAEPNFDLFDSLDMEHRASGMPSGMPIVSLGASPFGSNIASPILTPRATSPRSGSPEPISPRGSMTINPEAVFSPGSPTSNNPFIPATSPVLITSIPISNYPQPVAVKPITSSPPKAEPDNFDPNTYGSTSSPAKEPIPLLQPPPVNPHSFLRRSSSLTATQNHNPFAVGSPPPVTPTQSYPPTFDNTQPTFTSAPVQSTGFDNTPVVQPTFVQPIPIQTTVQPVPIQPTVQPIMMATSPSQPMMMPIPSQPVPMMSTSPAPSAFMPTAQMYTMGVPMMQPVQTIPVQPLQVQPVVYANPFDGQPVQPAVQPVQPVQTNPFLTPTTQQPVPTPSSPTKENFNPFV